MAATDLDLTELRNDPTFDDLSDEQLALVAGPGLTTLVYEDGTVVDIAGCPTTLLHGSGWVDTLTVTHDPANTAPRVDGPTVTKLTDWRDELLREDDTSLRAALLDTVIRGSST